MLILFLLSLGTVVCLNLQNLLYVLERPHYCRTIALLSFQVFTHKFVSSVIREVSEASMGLFVIQDYGCLRSSLEAICRNKP